MSALLWNSLCLEIDGAICRKREVYFWSRSKFPREEDISLGRRLISRLCVQSDQRYTTVQNPAATCNRRVNRQCRYDHIPVANPFSSARTTGKWYVIRSYPPGFLEPFELFPDATYTLDGPSGLADFSYRDTQTGQCVYSPQITLRELRSGVFEYFEPVFLNRTVGYKASYASANRQYGIALECLEVRGRICTDPTVSFVSRGKSTLTSEELAELEALVKDLCVDPSVNADVVHGEGCPSKENTPDVKPQPSPDQYDELIQAHKEMLEASRDKFRAETDTMRMLKQKVELEIQRLRLMYPWN